MNIIQVKFSVKPGFATPGPPVAPALGQYGVNIVDFCKKYNAMSSHMKDEDEHIVKVYIHLKKKTFTFVDTGVPTSVLIRKYCNIAKGSSLSGHSVASKISRDQLLKIAKYKLSFLNSYDVHAAIKEIAGTARSMGVVIEDDPSES